VRLCGRVVRGAILYVAHLPALRCLLPSSLFGEKRLELEISGDGPVVGGLACFAWGLGGT
jgi:hypothetical protein